MEDDVYSEFLLLEQTHWWFTGRRKIFFTLINKFLNEQRTLKILDVGCGPGEMIEHLSSYGIVTASDLSIKALSFCVKRGYNRLFIGDGGILPIKNETFDFVTLFDTLEHVDDDVEVLRESNRVLKTNGMIIITLPAYNLLYSDNDRAAHHKRRYTVSEIKKKAILAKFDVLKATYINTLLFPPIFCILMLIKIKEFFFPQKNPDKTNISFAIPKLVNSILESIFCFESHLLKKISFPFGHSLVCLARKRK